MMESSGGQQIDQANKPNNNNTLQQQQINVAHQQPTIQQQNTPYPPMHVIQQQQQQQQQQIAQPNYNGQVYNTINDPSIMSFAHQFGGMPNQHDEDYIKHMEELSLKFAKIKESIEKQPNELNAFKQQQLPLARIKKIMKSDEDVRMISSEAPILFALACQMFITEITHKAAFYAKKHGRKTLQRNDVARVIAENDTFDFLLDVIPKDEVLEQVNLTSNQRQLLADVQNMRQLPITQGGQDLLDNVQPNQYVDSKNNNAIPTPILQIDAQKEYNEEYQQQQKDESDNE